MLNLFQAFQMLNVTKSKFQQYKNGISAFFFKLLGLTGKTILFFFSY